MDGRQLKDKKTKSRFTYRDLELEAEEEVGVDYTGRIFTKEDTLTPFQVTVEVTVGNDSDEDGEEDVLLYVSAFCSFLRRSVTELKGSQSIYLKPGEEKTVNLLLLYDAFGFYNEKKACFETEAGEFEIIVASSDGEIKESAIIELEKGYYYAASVT